MAAPHLSRKLVLETRGTVPDGAGGFAPGWTGLGTVWADMAPRSGRETRGDGGSRALTSWRITLRAAPVGSPARPEPGQRLREGTRIFRIQAVHEAEAGPMYLTVHASEERVT